MACEFHPWSSRNTGADFNQSIKSQTADSIRVSNKFLPFNSSENKSLVKTKFQSPAAHNLVLYLCLHLCLYHLDTNISSPLLTTSKVKGETPSIRKMLFKYYKELPQLNVRDIREKRSQERIDKSAHHTTHNRTKCPSYFACSTQCNIWMLQRIT